MMIDIPRLRGSEFDSTLDDGAWRAGLNLWMTSWHQVPAGSLPDDDASLAKHAGLGRDVRTWRKVKAEALRGWEKCDDGLLYHETVAEMALEAWIEKLAQALSSGAGNATRWGTAFDPAPIEAEIDRAVEMLAAINPKSKALAKVARRKSRSPAISSPTGKRRVSRRDTNAVPSGSLGTGTGTGTRVEDEGLTAPSSLNDAAAVRSTVPADVRDVFVEHRGIAWTCSYIDRCVWLEEERLLVPRTHQARVAIQSDGKKALAELAEAGRAVRVQDAPPPAAGATQTIN